MTTNNRQPKRDFYLRPPQGHERPTCTLRYLVPFAGNGSARSVGVPRSHHARGNVRNMRRNVQLAVLGSHIEMELYCPGGLSGHLDHQLLSFDWASCRERPTTLCGTSDASRPHTRRPPCPGRVAASTTTASP